MDPIYTAATQGNELPAIVLGFVILFYLALFGVVLWIYGRIVAKAGYPWPWIFMMFVPIANIVFICIFAFKTWPIEQELAATRHALLAATGSPYPGPQFGGQLGGQLGAPVGGAFGGQPGGQFGVQPAFDHGGYAPSNEQGYQPGYDQRGYSDKAPSDNPYGPKY